MQVIRRLLLISPFLLCSTANADVVNKGYSTQLHLDEPIPIGLNQTIAGGGAVDSVGVYVELWRLAAGATVPESLGSVPITSGGRFAFEGIDVAVGDAYWVTLSYGWYFETDGDFEGWNQQVSPDAMVEVRDGALRITVHDGNGDGFYDAFLHNFFRYDARFYRVVEVRLRNASAVSPSILGILFGNPWSVNKSMHNADMPASMTDFETFLIPMNVDETRIQPPPVEHTVDGLWDNGHLNDCLRIDPLNSLPRFHPGVDGAVIEIDHIRLREDYRLEFDTDGDLSGIDVAQDMSNLTVAGGFFSYDVAGGAPSFLSNLMTGKLESGHFTRFVMGLEGSSVATEPNQIGVSFRDDDSGTDYLDDDGSQQTAVFGASFAGRQDLAVDLDSVTGGEWTEDGGVHVQGLEFAAPWNAATGDHVRIDYLGFVPANPFGPSDTVVVAAPNSPPLAVIVTEPDPPVVKLVDHTASAILDGSLSDDGDGGSQGLSYSWEKVSGPTNSIEAPVEPVTQVIFSHAGEYVYRLTVSDGMASHSADIAVLVEEPIFLRGDVNANGVSMELADALSLSRFLFGSGTAPVCPDAADVNDSGDLDISDVVAILWFGRRGSDAPSSLLACGPDETEDELRGCRYPEEACPGTLASTDSKLADKKWDKKNSESKLLKKLEKEQRKLDRK